MLPRMTGMNHRVKPARQEIEHADRVPEQSEWTNQIELAERGSLLANAVQVSICCQREADAECQQP